MNSPFCNESFNVLAYEYTAAEYIDLKNIVDWYTHIQRCQEEDQKRNQAQEKAKTAPIMR